MKMVGSEDNINDWKEEEESTVKDNKCLAILTMSLSTFFGTCMAATYKVIAVEGFHIAEFTVMRNISSLVIASIWCCFSGYQPLKLFPWNNKYTLLSRSFAGQANFVLLNLGISMAPISLVMFVWQTNPFWVSIMAYFMLKEAMYRSEVIAMFICFAGVAIIASQSE